YLGLIDGDVPGDILWRGILPEQQVEALGRHPADRILTAGTHPDLRMRSLRRRRLDDDIVELPVFPPMGEGLVGGPRLEDYLEALVEPSIGLLHGYAEAGELVVAVAFADAEIEPTAG